jgi:hypothetical protein
MHWVAVTEQYFAGMGDIGFRLLAKKPSRVKIDLCPMLLIADNEQS